MADKADPDDTPMVPRSISQSRKSTITASVASHDSRSVSPPSSNNAPLGLPKDSALDAEESIERKNNQSRSSLDQNTRPSSPTSERGASRRTNNQPVQFSRGTELGSSNHFQMHSSPFQSRSDAGMQAINDQPDLAVKPEVEIFVIMLFGSRTIVEKCPNETLTDRIVYNIFDEVSTRISKSDIQGINFKLGTSKKEVELECLLERENMVIFEVMIQKFNERIEERKKAGETTFKMLLELYPSSEKRQK